MRNIAYLYKRKDIHFAEMSEVRITEGKGRER